MIIKILTMLNPPHITSDGQSLQNPYEGVNRNWKVEGGGWKAQGGRDTSMFL